MPSSQPNRAEPVDECLVKLAIVGSLVNVLAEWDWSLMEGFDSELTLVDGSVITLTVKRKA